MSVSNYKLVVIGSDPAGQKGAIAAAKAKLFLAQSHNHGVYNRACR